MKSYSPHRISTKLTFLPKLVFWPGNRSKLKIFTWNFILSPTDKGGGLHRLLLKSPSLISSPPLRACEGRWTWNQRGGLELKLHEVHLVVKFSEAELARLRRTWLPSAPSVVLTQCQWRGCQVHRGRACEVRCTWQSLSWHWARVYDVHLLYQLDLM